MLYSPLFGKISFNEPLSLHTSIRAGGPARVWAEPQTKEQLCEIVKLSKNGKISIFTIGAGCNIIAQAKGIDGICIRLNSSIFKKIKFKGNIVTAGAGVGLSELFKSAAEHSLGGYEFLAGIPGTVGGAIFQNAGTPEEGISTLLAQIEAVDLSGRLKRIKGEGFKFGYRHSALEGNIIIQAAFKFKKSNSRNVKSLLRANLIKKMNSQDYTAPSAGCVFKNPRGFYLSAGELIDRCGLKGRAFGGAQVSKRHANFIINKNNATPQDILSLIKFIKRKVKEKYNIDMEEEVKIIGER